MRETLVDRFWRVAERARARECIVEGSRRVTYGEMSAEVAAAAVVLRDRISGGDRVALLLESSPEYVAACYGTWTAGGVVVGLNTALRAADIAALVRHCGARCLVADPAHREFSTIQRLLGSSVPVVEAPSGRGFAGAGGGGIAPVVGRGEGLACIMYTSGTTGDPKGVMLSHSNLAANRDSICEYLGIDEHERALCVLPFYYSFGASVLHTHVSTGAAIIVERSFMYPHAVMARVAEEHATSFAGVPSTFHLLLRRTDLSAFDLSSLRYVTQAGGRMEYERIREFRKRVPHAAFVVMYGQTEATARLTYLPAADLDRKPGSAGRAIMGVELRVRDERGQDLPVGEVGEVCARGDNVMMGYWKDPTGTNEVLREGWLHTGDLGHLDAEGYVFLQGRARELIKTGAHRVAPAEIEGVIRGVPGVDDVAVVGVDDDILGQAVKALVIAGQPGDALRNQILRTCRESLALFKIPKVVEFRDDLPRTASGKVRKHLL